MLTTEQWGKLVPVDQVLTLPENRKCRRWAPRSTQTSRPQPASFRPHLEALEDRCLFSTLTVTSFQDSGAGSLRATITAAESGDTIVFSPTLFNSTTTSASTSTLSAPLLSRSTKGNNGKGNGKPTSPPPPPPPPPIPTITLSSGELLLAKNLTIQGPGAGQLVISGSGSRAFEVAEGSAVTLSGLTIKGSSSFWTSYPVVTAWAGYGGGILSHGTLTLSACTVSGSVQGALARGGGIFNDGTLNVIGCTISNSFADGSTSSYENPEAASGAGIANFGVATLTNTIISNNRASATTTYPWFNKGGGILNQGTLALAGCTISGNYARNEGGGIFNSGTLDLSGCTVSGNASGNNGDGIYNFGTVTIKNSSTLTGNTGGDTEDFFNLGVLYLDATSTIGVLAGNAAILI
jgi:hypothetical protein